MSESAGILSGNRNCSVKVINNKRLIEKYRIGTGVFPGI